MSAKKSDRLFENKHVVADLDELVVKGGIVKMASQGLRLALRIGGIVVMARLLTPADYGVYVMGISFTLLLSLFEDFGLSRATIQSKEITHRLVSTLFWINVALGVALWLATAVAAPFVARFYGDPRVLNIMLVMGVTFALASLSVQHDALLQRQMRFKSIELINISAHLAGAIAMYTAAWLGWGYWALALNLIFMRLTLTVMCWFATGWIPGWPSRGVGARRMLEFGGNLSGYHVVNYLHRNLDNILIGHYWGPQQLGYYTKAYSLLKQPLVQVGDPLTGVMVPALSRLQDDAARFREYFIMGARGVVFLGVPFVVFAYVDAEEIILTLLGGQWLPVAPLFRALGPAALLGTTNILSGWLFQALGRTDRMFKSGTAVLGVMIVAFGLGVAWGARGIALAYSAAYCLIAVPLLAYATRGTPVSLADLFGAAWRPIVIFTLAGVGTLELKRLWTGPSLPVLRLLVDGLLFTTVSAAAWALFPGGLDFLRSVSTPVLRRVADSWRARKSKSR